MSCVITPVNLEAVVQVSETRMTLQGKDPRTIHENLLKSMIVLGDKARFVMAGRASLLRTLPTQKPVTHAIGCLEPCLK